MSAPRSIFERYERAVLAVRERGHLTEERLKKIQKALAGELSKHAEPASIEAACNRLKLIASSTGGREAELKMKGYVLKRQTKQFQTWHAGRGKWLVRFKHGKGIAEVRAKTRKAAYASMKEIQEGRMKPGGPAKAATPIIEGVMADLESARATGVLGASS